MSLAQQPTIHSIDFAGLKKSKKSYLKKLLTQEEGKQLSKSKVANDLVLLLREPVVSHAYEMIDTLPTGQLQLTYHIEENKTLIPAVDVWQSVNRSFAFHLGLTDYNFLGRGYTIGGFYRQNNFPGFGLILENNNFIRPENELKLLVQQHETLEPLKIDDTDVQYRYRLRNIEISIGRNLTLKHKIVVAGGLIDERYLLYKGSASEVIPNEFTTIKSFAKAGHVFDYIQPFYYHLNGWQNQVFTTYVWGESINQNNDFYSIENRSKYFRRFNNLGNLCFRANLGLAKNIDSPFPPFAIDNNQNVRGAGNLVQRGNAYWSFNTEYRHTLFEKGWFTVQGNVFIDLAGIQPIATPLHRMFAQTNRYQYGGAGLRFIHKYIYKAIFRIDYGFSLNGTKKSGVTFGIGQFF